MQSDKNQTTRLGRRAVLRGSLCATVGVTFAPWLAHLAARAASGPERHRSCILLWMPGGPSQLDTFDPKPEHENGGPYRSIATRVPGIEISEHLPELARRAHHLAIVRSMSTKEGDHLRASQLVRTGYPPLGPIDYPAITSLFAHRLATPDCDLPACVSVGLTNYFGGGRGFSPGFLGPRFAPLDVRGTVARAGGEVSFEVPYLATDKRQANDRLALWTAQEERFTAQHPGANTAGHRESYLQAERMMYGSAADAFQLSSEPAHLRDRYGRSTFGQGCLLARRLIERGVACVEVVLTGDENPGAFGWDTHQNNFEIVQQHSAELDAGWSTLLDDLQDRGLLDSTLIVWMGEFGRTPKINGTKGRDHFPTAWSAVLSGGGIRGGQVVGRTSHDGMSVEDRLTTMPDLLATVALALGLDPHEQNMSNVGRPIRLADPSAQPLEQCLT